MTKRQRNTPWRGIYGIDRHYTARVDRAVERGEYTPPPQEEKYEAWNPLAMAVEQGLQETDQKVE